MATRGLSGLPAGTPCVGAEGGPIAARRLDGVRSDLVVQGVGGPELCVGGIHRGVRSGVEQDATGGLYG